jgi:hypothetical protein
MRLLRRTRARLGARHAAHACGHSKCRVVRQHKLIAAIQDRGSLLHECVGCPNNLHACTCMLCQRGERQSLPCMYRVLQRRTSMAVHSQHQRCVTAARDTSGNLRRRRTGIRSSSVPSGAPRRAAASWRRPCRCQILLEARYMTRLTQFCLDMCACRQAQPTDAISLPLL